MTPVGQDEEVHDFTGLQEGGRQLAKVDEVHHSLHCFFSGLLDGQLPSDFSVVSELKRPSK